ncbi:hypothetical protein [Streptomyces ipomoeae]|uniref:hypothetical protein n=1 Tax=Streptomyces ipomoeae TaxID=103232 RepID=UPI0029A1A073|nr:hypothetical protein [Streptomyces ipomoeae]MDX2697580.1 hypothetical protein [Streptomyces ipomoeae]
MTLPPTIDQLRNLADRAAHGLTPDEQARLREGITRLAEYENTINWMTTCTSCARVLDSGIRETERAERAEAAITRVRNLAARIRQGAPWTANHDNLADRILAAATLDEPAPATPATTQAADTPVVDRQTAVVLAALHRSAEADVTHVIDLYERWVKAGPPPLGMSMSRWWDMRLAELHNAIRPADNEEN